ncbi:MAG TPA: peroxiredoxin family protein [Terriglobales bacterium]|nr:peroxiredoxin family protein [Terriglobales bacterium]
MKRASCVLAILLAVCALAQAQDIDKPPPRPAKPARVREHPASPVPAESRITSQVYLGEPAPDFELDGSEGRPVRLAHLKGYWVLLVFSDRREPLASLGGVHPSLVELGIHAYGICRDKAYTLKSYTERHNLQVVLLSDVTGEISEMYGLFDHNSGSIRPGFVLMDRQGLVQMALFGQNLPASTILDMVKSAVEGT